jgi:dynein intermediate chain
VRTVVGEGRALNKMRWDHKDGRRAAMGGSDGRLHVYDIGDMAIPRETEWNDLQKSIAGFTGASSQEPEPLSSSLRVSVNGR